MSFGRLAGTALEFFCAFQYYKYMDNNLFLQVGDVSDNGQVTIIDEDRLCYQVKSISKGAIGIRTISKVLLQEFIKYRSTHPNSSANQAREALSGTSEVDRFEYGYASTLIVMADMALQASKDRRATVLQHDRISTDPLQQIFYGAPGTGKSFAIETATEGEDVIRTTFHPDSDYSTFVGAYKPTTKEVPVISNFGGKAIKVKDEEGNDIKEERIVYEFVNQAFLQAYVGAWQKLADNTIEPKKQYLVIEEINRGNCAQIFGDLFQLLDRNPQGFSEYPIKADADMKKQLKKQLAGLSIENAAVINAMYKNEDVVSKVLDGDILLLPCNLFIWATMNTSDQSLFPIDSAFKRRWDWKYVPIANAEKNWAIDANGKKYDWWDFLNKINALIGETTNSEDKKLGYFFCKTQTGIIDAETFVGKVIFYLWNDVFKDFEFEGDVFVDVDGETKLTFDKFYNPDATVRESTVEVFLNNLVVILVDETEEEEFIPDEDEAKANVNDHSSYLFNGAKINTKADLGLAIISKYIEEHQELTFEDIKNIFPNNMLGRIQYKGLIVKSDIDLASYARYYSKTYTSQDGIMYRVFKQWTIDNIDNIIAFAREQEWSVDVLND